MHGRDIVAPPGNQAATENTNFALTLGKCPAYSKPDDTQNPDNR
jgi:hypothetical protein